MPAMASHLRPVYKQKKAVKKKIQTAGGECSAASTPKRYRGHISGHQDLLYGPTRHSPRLLESQHSDNNVSQCYYHIISPLVN